MTKTIFRKAKNKDNPYVMISKAAIQDERLSWKDTGLLTYLLSLPDDWTIYIHEIINHKKDGVTATRTAIRHLQQFGYLEKRVHRNNKQQIVKHEYIIHEEPQLENLIVGNQTLLNNEYTNDENKVQRLQKQYNEQRWRDITQAPDPMYK